MQVAAPPVSKGVARPAAGGSAYAAGQVIIYQRGADGSYSQVASSWPTTGLLGAGVSIAPLSGPTPALTQQGPFIDASKPPLTGGVNSGYPDSMCVADDRPPSSDPGAGVSTTALGDAPAYYEVGQPAGSYAGASPKGVILLFNGGGWYTVGSGAVAALRPDDGLKNLVLQGRGNCCCFQLKQIRRSIERPLICWRTCSNIPTKSSQMLHTPYKLAEMCITTAECCYATIWKMLLLP